MTAWLFPRLDAAVGSAGSYVDAPWRVLMHTTEVDADPRGWVPGWVYPSHVVADYEHQVIVQCLPLDEAGKALENLSGGVETNRDRCLQVEVNGHADVAADWSPDKLRWIGEQVLAPIVRWVRAQGGDIDLRAESIPLPGEIAGSASYDAPQRLTFDEWSAFGSVCGHRHAPENSHYDAGGLDMRAVAAYAAAVLDGPSSTPSTEGLPPDMTTTAAVRRDPDGFVYDITYLPEHGSEVAPGVRVASRVAIRPVEFFDGQFIVTLNTGNGAKATDLLCNGRLTTVVDATPGSGLCSVVGDRELIVEGHEVVYVAATAA